MTTTIEQARQIVARETSCEATSCTMPRGRFRCRHIAYQIVALVREEDARVARNGCLVPPDGGEPTEAERQLCDRIATAIIDQDKRPDILGLEQP